MSAKTLIEWTDFTVNFWWGCTKVSPACAHCYALSIARRLGKSLFGFTVEWGDGKPRAERLDKARKEAMALNLAAGRRGVRYRVFVNSMSDWLDDQVPTEWLASLLETIHLCPNLDFQLLTKRPENWAPRMKAIRDEAKCVSAEQGGGFLAMDWRNGYSPANVWIGTTVENQEWAEKRLPDLIEIPAKVRFLSCEPLLGALDLDYWLVESLVPQVDWVICGGESGQYARPMHPDWARSLRDQCAAAGVPFFFKQWGEWSPLPDGVAFDDEPWLDVPFGEFHKSGLGWIDYCLCDDGAATLYRVGKKLAGRLLDGVEYSEFPVLDRINGISGISEGVAA